MPPLVQQPVDHIVRVVPCSQLLVTARPDFFFFLQRQLARHLEAHVLLEQPLVLHEELDRP